MDAIAQLSLLLGPSFLSGINAYATIGFLGLFARLGWLTLPGELNVLTQPVVFGIALFLFAVEFIVDKVPALDSMWDSVHTFVRIPAGALLAYAAVGSVAPELQLGALLLGGTLAATTHATKSAIRAMINWSPEPFSNWILSFAEDGFVLLCLLLIFYIPFLMLAIIGGFLIFFIWFFPKIFRFLKTAFRKGLNVFKSPPEPQ